MGRSSDNIISRLRIGAITGVIVLAGALFPSSAFAAQAAESTRCSADYVVRNPVRFAVGAEGLLKTYSSIRIMKDEFGYRAIVVVEIDASGHRLRLVHFDDDGNVLRVGWLSGKRENQRLVDYGFDDAGRAVAAWAGDRISLERYTYDGERDQSFSRDGRVGIDPKASKANYDLNVHWSESGAYLFLNGPDTAYRVSDSGDDVRGPYDNPGAAVVTPGVARGFGPFPKLPNVNKAYAITDSGDILYPSEGGISRLDIEGKPVNRWHGDGFRPTNDLGRAAGQWLYNEKTGVLTLMRLTAGGHTHITRVAADGRDAIEQLYVDDALWTAAEFADGSLIGMKKSDDHVYNLRTDNVVDSPYTEDPSHLQPIRDSMIGLNYLSGVGVFDEDGAGSHIYEAAAVVTTGQPGGLSDQIRRLYLAFRLNPPQGHDLYVLRHSLATGTSVRDLAATLARSSSFVNDTKNLDDWQYTTWVYTHVADRNPSPSEYGYWTHEFGVGRQRSDLLAQLSQTQKFAEITDTTAVYGSGYEGSIQRLYRAYFGRQPDVGGLCYWVAFQRRTPTDRLDVVSDSFAESAEFKATYGHLSNAQFVDLVYRNVMDRSPDAGGRAYWLGLLDRGLNRGVLMLYFSESPEYVLKTDTAR